jgi:hypothetical protein
VFTTNDICTLIDMIISNPSNLCKSYFVNHFLLNSCDNCSLSKGCVILWSMLWKWFHSFNSKNIWIYTSTCKQLPLLMCQHDMVDKGFGSH